MEHDAAGPDAHAQIESLRAQLAKAEHDIAVYSARDKKLRQALTKMVTECAQNDRRVLARLMTDASGVQDTIQALIPVLRADVRAKKVPAQQVARERQ